MSGLNFTLLGWNDNLNLQRTFIVHEIANKLNTFYKNEYINNYPLQICLRKSVLCNDDYMHPCAHSDRSRICITTEGAYWCQFIFQLSHELCHCTTSRNTLPQSIKWFDEFLCCFTSYFILKQFENDYRVISVLFPNNFSAFTEYLQNEEFRHNYETEDTCKMFEENFVKYLINENLIKDHDVYYIRFYDMLNNNFDGLSFIGKMHLVDTRSITNINDFLMELEKLCNTSEKGTLNLILSIFGLTQNLMGKVA